MSSDCEPVGHCCLCGKQWCVNDNMDDMYNNYPYCEKLTREELSQMNLVRIPDELLGPHPESVHAPVVCENCVKKHNLVVVVIE